MLLPSYSLRVSVLEQCQLRCAYCDPPRGKDKKRRLSIADYEKAAKVFSRLPLDKIRFTGGEPLLRKELPQIISCFHETLPKLKLCLTTNGLRFGQMAHELKQAGLSQVTFHLDTLKEERYQALMGEGSVRALIDALEAAQNLSFVIKINMVVQKNLNDDELIDFLDFSQRYNVEVRFIEMMNTGSAAYFVRKHFISGEEILRKITSQEIIEKKTRTQESDPAEKHYAKKRQCYFGLIASDTRSFCKDCNRLRLNADGKVLTCLYDPFAEHLDFSQSDEELFSQLLKKIGRKESFHPSLIRPKRRLFSMSEGGG